MRKQVVRLLLLGLLSGCAASQPVYYWEQSVWEPGTNLRRYAFWRLDPDTRQHAHLFDLESGWGSVLSPDGKQLAMLRTRPGPQGEWLTDLVLRDLESGRSRVLRAGSQVLNLSDLRWSPDGTQLAYVYTLAVNGRVFRTQLALIDVKSGYSFDLSEPEQFSSISQPAWSPDGRWLAMNALPTDAPLSRLALYDLKTRSWRLLALHLDLSGRSATLHFVHAWRPDGKGFLFSSRLSGQENLHLYDLASETHTQLTSMSEVYGTRVSPDGDWILFRAACERAVDCGLVKDPQTTELEPLLHQLQEAIPFGLFVIRSDGTGLRKLMSFSEYGELSRHEWHLSRTGLKILYSLSKVASCRFFTMNLAGGEITCL